MANLRAPYVIFCQAFYPEGQHLAYFSVSSHYTLGAALRALRALALRGEGSIFRLYNRSGGLVKEAQSNKEG